MEKENVLEIEFIPVWDRWAWKVTKNKLETGFEFESLENSRANIIRVCFDFFVDENYLLSAFEKEKLEKLIKVINEKYGIRKRWRAEYGKIYYYVDSVLDISISIENHYALSNVCYERGNYFRTKEEAEEYAEYMRKKSIEWHEKRDNNE